MGPRLEGRGEWVIAGGCTSVFHASMGPRLEGRGEDVYGLPFLKIVAALQWGRGWKAVESRMSSSGRYRNP